MKHARNALHVLPRVHKDGTEVMALPPHLCKLLLQGLSLPLLSSDHQQALVQAVQCVEHAGVASMQGLQEALPLMQRVVACIS